MAASDRFRNICDGLLRVLGDLYRFRQEPQDFPLDDWPDWQSARAKVRNYLEACETRGGVAKASLFQAVWTAVCERSGHPNLVLDPRNLWVKLAIPGDSVWICTSCRREHLHDSGGVCTHCLVELPTEATTECGALYAKNYYAFEAVNRREPAGSGAASTASISTRVR